MNELTLPAGMKRRLLRVPHLVLRMYKDKQLSVPRTLISCADDAAEVAHHVIGKYPDEYLIALLLDGRSNLTGITTIAKGGFHGLGCTAADVLRHVLAGQARAFVLAHNHPSGDPAPSHQDKEFTGMIAQAAALINLPCVDHVIVTSRSQEFSSINTDV